MTGNEVVEVEQSATTALGISEDEAAVIRAYLIFVNGDGLRVFNDLMETFYYFESDGMNEELADVPDPYREYTKKGMRMVMDKIRLITKVAEEI